MLLSTRSLPILKCGINLDEEVSMFRNLPNIECDVQQNSLEYIHSRPLDQMKASFCRIMSPVCNKTPLYAIHSSPLGQAKASFSKL